MSKLKEVFTKEVIHDLKEHKEKITSELLEKIRSFGNEGKELCLEILDTKKNEEDYYVDSFGNKISLNGFRDLKRPFTQMDLADIHIEEIKKCKNSLNYFMDNYVKIKTNKGVNFPELRDYQQKFIEALLDPVESVVGLLPRQSGKSITTSIYLTWQFLFNQDINIGICANKSKLAFEFLNNVKNIFINLPMWMKVGIKVWNTSGISAENGMRVLTDSPSSDSFRGFSCIDGDEEVTVRNKYTNKIQKIKIKDLYKEL